jgi:hypothetical protein
MKTSILKIDLDVKPPEEWLQEWIETRKLILFAKGLDVTKIYKHPTEKGWHFWFHLSHPISFDEAIKLQFILGDDQQRVYFSLQRKGFTKFKHLFNILFSKKLGESK